MNSRRRADYFCAERRESRSDPIDRGDLQIIARNANPESNSVLTTGPRAGVPYVDFVDAVRKAANSGRGNVDAQVARVEFNFRTCFSDRNTFDL